MADRNKLIWLIFALVIAAIAGGVFYLLYQNPEEKRLYEYYHASFYKHYTEKNRLSPDQADYYARHYAHMYAAYFASPEYRLWLEFALPEASEEAFAYPNSPIADLKTSKRGIDAIKYFEGYRATPYRDAGGKMTIGYGHLLRQSEIMTGLNAAEAEKLLMQDIKLAEAILKRSVKVELSQPQFDALISLIFNIGSGQFADSTMLEHLNNNNLNAAAEEFTRWIKVGSREIDGLKTRRDYEKALFISG